MLRRLTLLPLLLAATVAAAPAQASSESDQDLRCLAVGLSLIEENPNAGLVAAMYFLGRLEGREPGVDWFDRVAQHMAKTKLEQLKADAVVCGQILIEKGEEMTRKGEELEQQGL